MSNKETKLDVTKEELATISIALSLLAFDRVDAANAAERERLEAAHAKALDLLLTRIEQR